MYIYIYIMIFRFQPIRWVLADFYLLILDYFILFYFIPKKIDYFAMAGFK